MKKDTEYKQNNKKNAEKRILIVVNIVLCSVFVGIITAVGIFAALHMANPDKPTRSIFEQRPLEQIPDFSVKALFSGEFTHGFDLYFSDNFPLREDLVQVATFLKRFKGVRGFNPDSTIIIDGNSDLYSDGNEKVGPGDTAKFDREIVLNNEASSEVQEDFLPGTDVTSDTDSTKVENDEKTAETITPVFDENIAGEQRDSLYIVGDTALELFKGNEKTSTYYINTLNAYAEYIPEGVNIYNIVIPSHTEFRLPKVDRNLASEQKPVIDNIRDNLDERIVFVDGVYDSLKDHYNRGEYLYFRTDHHWTALGAYYAYEEYCKSAGLECIPLESYETGKFEKFLGSFYKQTSREPALAKNPDYVEYYKIDIPYTASKYDNNKVKYKSKLYYNSVGNPEANAYMCFLGGDFPYVEVVTENKNGRKLMVFKESFGNPLVPFLAQHYEEVHVADIRDFPYNSIGFIKQKGITDVLFVNGIMSANSKAQGNNLNKLFNN